jgi:hypothetical protein
MRTLTNQQCYTLNNDKTTVTVSFLPFQIVPGILEFTEPQPWVLTVTYLPLTDLNEVVYLEKSKQILIWNRKSNTKLLVAFHHYLFSYLVNILPISFC